MIIIAHSCVDAKEIYPFNPCKTTCLVYQAVSEDQLPVRFFFSHFWFNFTHLQKFFFGQLVGIELPYRAVVHHCNEFSVFNRRGFWQVPVSRNHSTCSQGS